MTSPYLTKLTKHINRKEGGRKQMGNLYLGQGKHVTLYFVVGPD